MFRVVICILLLFVYMQTAVDQLPRLGKRELICFLLFTCNYVVSVWRGFLFRWVLGMGYVVLLWHSLSLPLIILQEYTCRSLKRIRWKYQKTTHLSRCRNACHIYTWKKVREHLLCYEGKLWTMIFLQSKYVLTKLFSKLNL